MECAIEDLIDGIIKYTIETDSIELSVDKLKQVSTVLHSSIHQYGDVESVKSEDFITSVRSAFESVDPYLIKHFRYMFETETISRALMNS